MPPGDPAISVSTSADRLSQRQQIEEVLARALAKGDPVRIRIPVLLYDAADTRGYLNVRDASWNIQLPAVGLIPEQVEQLIQTIGRCIVAVAEQGSEQVLRKLDQA